MELHTIGIDLGKTVFHLVGLDLHGGVVVRKKFSRKQLLHLGWRQSLHPRHLQRPVRRWRPSNHAAPLSGRTPGRGTRARHQ